MGDESVTSKDTRICMIIQFMDETRCVRTADIQRQLDDCQVRLGLLRFPDGTVTSSLASSEESLALEDTGETFDTLAFFFFPPLELLPLRFDFGV